MNSLQKRRMNMRGLHLIGCCLLLAGLLVGCATSQPATGPTPVAQADSPEPPVREKPQAGMSQVVPPDQPAVGPHARQKSPSLGAREGTAGDPLSKLSRSDVVRSDKQFGGTKAEVQVRSPASNAAHSLTDKPEANTDAPASHGHAADGGCGDEESAASQPVQGPPETPPLPGHPRFACDKKAVKGEPVWQGQKAKFEFLIRNEGTGDLELRLKGG